MNSPLIATVSTILAALSFELLLMILLQGAATPYKYLVVLDSIALALMLSPVMYFLMYKPLKEAAKLHDELSETHGLLKGMLAMCVKCKKVQDQKGTWKQLKEYIEENTQTKFFKSICPTCDHNTSQHQPPFDFDNNAP